MKIDKTRFDEKLVELEADILKLCDEKRETTLRLMVTVIMDAVRAAANELAEPDDVRLP